MKWFKHDSDAAHDAKLRRVRLKYGMEGYGLYWYCLELIARNVDAHNLTFELEHDADLIAGDTAIHRDRVEEMMRFMIDQRLFESAEGIITCLKMASRTDEYTAKLLAKSGRYPAAVPTVSGQHPDGVGTKSVLLEQNRTEETHTGSARKHTAKPNGRAIKLPSDFALTADRRAIAVRYWTERGRTDLSADDEFEHFLAHHRKTGKGWVDWDAAWQTWYTNAPKFKRPSLAAVPAAGVAWK